MKKKEILKTIITIIVSVVLSSGISVYATSTYLYDSCDVSYDNTNSGLNASNVQSSLDELYMHATDYTSIREMIYPVGSIYISVTDDTVAKVQNRFGGTWEEFGKGRTLVGVDTSESEFNTVLKTGGEKTHTLTADELASHSHKIVVPSNTTSINYSEKITRSGGYVITGTASIGTGDYYRHLISNGMFTDGGGNQPHNNLQPYITVYMYKRVS